ncbi:hypothetical protein DV736_g5031, partial [Chaetothyriales sp. CBS 134916]
METPVHTDVLIRRPTASGAKKADKPIRPSAPLHHETYPTDLRSVPTSDLAVSKANKATLPRQKPYLIAPPEDMSTARSRKFSYASVKEESGEDIPQSFESSLSSEDLEEVEWIAWPCSHWCRTKGLCAAHDGGSHDDYVQARLDGYARSSPRKLTKILAEIEKRLQAQKFCQASLGPAVAKFQRSRTDSGLDAWGEKLKLTLARNQIELDEDAISIDSEDAVLLPPAPDHVTTLSQLESLPSEILNQIFSYVQVDHTADPYSRPKVDLAACAMTSKSLHAAAVRVMYRHVSIPQSKAFAKLLRTLTEDDSLGRLVQWLDFSHYSNMGFGKARSTSSRTPFLTPTTLKGCLDRLPNLRAFLVHEHVDDELDIEVLSKLFSMDQLQALDLTGCSSRPFADAFSSVCTLNLGHESSVGFFGHPLKRLSLHECTTLQEHVFEALLPRLGSLTHLDVAHTLVTDTALLSIPSTAQITHLNLERCTRLTGTAVVHFLTTHPAATSTLMYLNLLADASRHCLFSAEDITSLLPSLPSSLRSLNLGGAKVNSTHVSQLRRLATHLEELGLKGVNLSLSADINQILGIGEEDPENTPAPLRHRSTLRYIDLTDIKTVTQMSLSYSPDALTATHTEPLEVIELGSSVLDELNKRNKRVKNPEWVVRELGRRGWYVRQPRPYAAADDSASISHIADDGWRDWKMGARWWGMRKIPVLEQDVGGMYGYFMFKRN